MAVGDVATYPLKDANGVNRNIDFIETATGYAPLYSARGTTVISQASFTRPADTTAYAAKDVVCNSTSAPAVLTFSASARVNAGSGYITKVRLFTDQSTNTASYRLQLYNTSPTPINDNAAFTLLWANRAARIGYIDISNTGTEGSGSNAASGLNTDIRIPFVCGAADNALYGILETQTAFTPANAQLFFLELTCEQN